MATTPHYQWMIGVDQVPVKAQTPTDERKEESPKGMKDFLRMTPGEIAQALIKAGKAKDATAPGAGLQIFRTSTRRPHEYEGS